MLRLDASRRDGYRPIYHEYFHLLTSLNAGRLPIWLMEGLAEFYGNVAIRGDTVEIGDPRRDYLSYLELEKLLPLDALLTMVDDPHGSDRDAALLYAQSWALTHYILVGDGGARSEGLSQYVAQVQQGVDGRKAFEQAFGELDETERALSRYIRQGSFYGLRMDAPASVDEEAFTVRELSAAESSAVRAGVLIRGDRREEALALLEEALAVDDESAAVHEGMGLFHVQAEDYEEAAESFYRAVSLGSTSYIAHYLAVVLGNDAFAEAEDAERRLRRAIDLNPRFAPAYSTLAELVSLDDSRLDEALSLANQAAGLEPTTGEHWVAGGRILLRMNQPDAAGRAAEAGLRVVTSPEEREVLAAFLATLEDETVRLSFLSPLNRLRALAAQGDAEAQSSLGYRHLVGQGVPQDDVEAVRWLRQGVGIRYGDSNLQGFEVVKRCLHWLR